MLKHAEASHLMSQAPGCLENIFLYKMEDLVIDLTFMSEENAFHYSCKHFAQPNVCQGNLARSWT